MTVESVRSVEICRYLVIHFGPFIGYFAKPSKSWLIVKPKYFDEASVCFKNTGLNITTEGRKHLGALVGSDSFKESYVGDKVKNWIMQIEELSKIAWVEPHLAYCAYVQGFKHKFNYILRTIPDLKRFLLPLDTVINDKFIPVVLNGKIINEKE